MVDDTSGLTRATLKVWIYKGTQGAAVASGTDAEDGGVSNGRPEVPTKVLNATSVYYSDGTDPFVSFELSNYISSYINESYNGDANDSREPAMVWVDYQLTTTVNSVISIEALVQNIAYDGYTYFEDGLNHQYEESALITSDTVTRMEDMPVEIGFNTSTTTKVHWLKQGEIINTKSFSSSNESDEQIEYSTNGYDDADRFALRVAEDSGIMVSNRCLNMFKCHLEIFDCDTIQVEDANGITRLINVITLEANNHTPYKLTFVNKFGALEHLWFNGMHKASFKTTSKEYSRLISNYSNGGAYNTYDASKYKQRQSSTKGMTLNSGFYPEAANTSFEELLQSNEVWIDRDGTILPIIIKDSSFNFKTHLNDNAINYTLKIEYAFNKINNI